MPRYKLTIEYDGNGLCGWQVQDGQKSVQGQLEEAAFKFCGEQVKILCAGRTDAGVHARGQVGHFDVAKATDAFTVIRAINYHLIGQRIAVVDAEEVSEEFHARFSATGRHYRYTILNRRARAALDDGYVWQIPTELHVGAMQEAAKLLIGHHDFSSFRDSACQSKSPVKTLDRLEVTAGEDGRILIEASARSFLHHQVRNIVGSLALVGKGKWSVEDFRAARDAKDRRAGGPTAPAQGLCLLRVDY